MSVRPGFCRASLIGVVAALVVAVAGCGGSESKSDSDTTQNSESGAPRDDGRLDKVPEPLSLANLRDERPGSAQSAVLRLFYFAQWGSAPNVAAAYDPAVRAAVGVSNIAGTYSQQRILLSTSRLRILESTVVGTGTFVAVQLLRADGPPARHSFTLRRRLGRWQIVYDTILEGSLESYVASSRSRNPADRPPDRQAITEGRKSVRAYRSVFASIPDR